MKTILPVKAVPGGYNEKSIDLPKSINLNPFVSQPPPKIFQTKQNKESIKNKRKQNNSKRKINKYKNKTKKRTIN
jgi:hypothetical protein